MSSIEVAIAHDYLNQRGGGERVALAFSDLWPEAPIYTSLYRSESTFPEFRGRDIRTSYLDRLPVDKGFRGLFPLYPLAFGALGPVDAAALVVSSSGWAHLLPVHQAGVKVVYCHTPARWLYGGAHLRMSTSSLAVKPLLGYFRRLDRSAAVGADVYVANSQNIANQIRSVYGREAEVVHPPVDTDRFEPTERGDRLLVVSRLLPYKHVDFIVECANELGLGLDVVGVGPELPKLRALGDKSSIFHGLAGDALVAELMSSCAAVCIPAEEDFGIVSVEAQAAGKPVVAFGRGGSLETVVSGVTGSFFYDRSVTAFRKALEACNALPSRPSDLARHAERFSRQQFQVRMRDVVNRAIEDHATR